MTGYSKSNESTLEVIEYKSNDVVMTGYSKSNKIDSTIRVTSLMTGMVRVMTRYIKSTEVNSRIL